MFVMIMFFLLFVKVDRFSVEAADLGKIFKCKIRHDNSMLSPAWFLDNVAVSDPTDRETFVFYCERWLGKGKDDGKIDRTLYVKVRSHGFNHQSALK